MLIIEKVLLMKKSEIFQNCKETDLIEIAAVCEESYFSKGVTIFSKGSYGNCMYFIYSGSVSIHDEQHEFAVLSENEIFGELSLLDSETRSASATTTSDCVFLKIDQDNFFDIVATNTDVLKGILKTLCKRLREQDRVTVEMKKVKDQLAYKD